MVTAGVLLIGRAYPLLQENLRGERMDAPDAVDESGRGLSGRTG